MKIDWTTDSAGQMIGFSYHDAGLVGFEWEGKQSLRLKLATVDGNVSLVELCNLDMVTLRNVWDGMIVSDIFAWSVTSVPETVWSLDDGAWPVLLSGRVHRPDQRSAAAEIVKRTPCTLLFQVHSSYGGTLAALCESINVQTEAAAG